ncbi:MAG: VWA domain-containing protein [Spirochaetes bacterium]|nr:VWA domain-containing protein [Spirochaetota bacterium]
MTVICFIILVPPLWSQAELLLTQKDLSVEQNIKGGYDLWIRKKDGIASVLLAESTRDPSKKNPVFTLRDPGYNPVNGNEKRILNGKFLNSKTKLYFLVDSSPEKYKKFGEAFHIFIPYVVVYGYPWSRTGELQILDGTFLNLRTFSRPYADYSGDFKDNPFVLHVVQHRVLKDSAGKYMKEAVDKLTAIAESAGGKAVLSRGEDDMVDKIGDILDAAPGKTLDLVLALDTTESMYNDMPALKKRIIPLLREHTSKFSYFRVGLLFYKDYMDEYLVKPFPFTNNLSVIQRYINGVRVNGGRDIPEAVFEALYSSIHSYKWKAESRLIILIGDAPPHPKPLGKITADMVYRDAGKYRIKINTIILPQ